MKSNLLQVQSASGQINWKRLERLHSMYIQGSSKVERWLISTQDMPLSFCSFYDTVYTY